jgi:2'-5' RNA ligase
MNIGRLFRTSWRDMRASRRQDVAYKRTWSAFGYYPEIADGRHDTSDWQSSPGPFAICLIRVPASLLQPSLDEFRGALREYPFVRLHPDHFLHITWLVLGFVTDTPSANDEITPARLDEFVAGATAALAGAVPFDIRLGGANSFQDAAFLDVHDRGQCSRMHSRLRELAAVPTQPRYAYVPHCTVAHYDDARPMPSDLGESIERWRDRRFGSFTVQNLEVVTLDIDVPYPELQTLSVIPFAG